MRLLDRFFRRHRTDPPSQDPAVAPVVPVVAEHPGGGVPHGIRLAASKAVEQVYFVQRSYGLAILPDKNRLKHDVALMLSHDDLTWVDFDLIGHDGRLIFTFTIRFRQRAGRGAAIDSANGVEVPLLDRRQVAGGRFVVHRQGRDQAYRDLLALDWSDVARLGRRESDAYRSEHCRRITGGRQSGTFQLDRQFRYRLEITSSGGRGYAFARCVDASIDARIDNVFCHRNSVQDGCELTPGRQVTALVVQTPRGPQARAIRQA